VQVVKGFDGEAGLKIRSCGASDPRAMHWFVATAMLCRLFIPTPWKSALNVLQQCQSIGGRKSCSDAFDAKEWIESSFEFVIDYERAP